MIRGDLSVRGLAEFVCRQGDLYASRRGRQVTAEEGIQRQQEAQVMRQAQAGYQTEVSVQTSFVCGAETRLIKGRMDGLIVSDEKDPIVIEEFKCCGELPEFADAVDRGQAWLYAGMYANSHETADLYEIRLIYIHVDTRQEQVFSDTANRALVLANLAFILLCFTTRLEQHHRRSAARLAWADTLEFPLPSYRPSQQAIARRVFQALDGIENLLLEAPTGSGKTLAVLFPALKAQQLEDQLFFLTSRNAGAQAALAAATQLDPQRNQLSVVEITAKEKTCFVPGMPCDAQLCPYAAGYFDRAPLAVADLLSVKSADRAAIETVAEQHQVCPFELSLETALWADLVVGDYNYIFDPVVRLQRFVGHDRLHLLVDEAHQLSPRVRDMLTVRIERETVRQAKKTQLSDVKLPSDVRRRVASIDRALLAIRREFGEGDHVLASTTKLERALGRFMDVLAEQDIELQAHPELRELVFEVSRWRRSDAWYRPDQFVHHVSVNERQIDVTRYCLDPAPYLQSVFAEHAGIVRFSGTVTPLTLYQRLHGASDTHSERAQSPFQRDQALVLVVRDVATYYRQREASLSSLVSVIDQIVGAKPGRYLVAFPSYAYQRIVAEAWLGDDATSFIQPQGQSNEEAEALLQAFSASESAVMFIVMGGIYGESVDFSGASLSGVIMVGLGLPPPSLERNLMQDYFDTEEGSGWGRMVAYTQPALVKNIQAAGRLIRSPEDFGVICLVDPRFTSDEVQRFFPSHWRPQVTRSGDVRQAVSNFWHNKIPKEENSSR